MEKRDGYATTQKYPHPFMHELQLTTAQKIRGAVLGAVLFPLRVTTAALLFLVMWVVARLRLAGLPAERRAQPVQGWRRWLLQPAMLLLSRGVFFALGFLWIEVKGRRADPRDAPLLAVAPHSSFLDILVLVPTGLPTVVSRSENTSLPVIGALLEFNQSVLVSRNDPESRRKCVAQLKERLTSNGHWPQMLLFPEGTTTNGSMLIKFKPGAFVAGVPVQPVLLRYPNKLDTVRWTWKGTSWVQALWHTVSQLYSNVTVEYLPVYNPSQEEKYDPTLYADNIQKLMAKELKIPATDYVMSGRVPVRKMGCLSLPVEPPARDALTILLRAGLSASDLGAALIRMMDSCHSCKDGHVCVDELASLLQLTDRQTAVEICDLYSKGGQVDLRQLSLSLAAVSGLWSLDSLIHTAFSLYNGDCRGSLSAVELSDLLGALVGFKQHNICELYSEMSSRGQPTKQDLLALLTAHSTYQRLFTEYLRPEEAGPTKAAPPSTNRAVGHKAILSYKKAD